MSENEEGDSFLTPRQGRFLGFVACFGAAWLLGLLLIGVVVVLHEVFAKFSSLIWSLAVAAVLSIMLRPVVAFFDSRLRLGRAVSVLLLYILVVGVSGVGLWLIGGKVVEQAGALVESAREWPTKLETKAEEWLPEEVWNAASGQVEAFKTYWNEMFGSGSTEFGVNPEVEDAVKDLSAEDKRVFLGLDDVERQAYLDLNGTAVREEYLARKEEEGRTRALVNIDEQGEMIAEKSVQVIKSTWEGLTGFFFQLTYLAVIPIYMFYFLGSKRDLLEDFEQEITFLSPKVREDVVFLIREFVSILVAFFRGQLLIGLLMGVGYAVGFHYSGLKFGLALGLLFGLLNIVPYLGSIVGLLTTALVAYLQQGGIAETGDWSVLFGCGVAFVVVQLVESYFLTPRIMGRQTGLHPVVVIVAIFFWGTALGGILGMLFGIPLTAFIIVTWRLLCRKYFARSAC